MTKYEVRFTVESDSEWTVEDDADGRPTVKILDDCNATYPFEIWIPIDAEIEVVPEPIPEFPLGSIARRLSTGTASFYFKNAEGWQFITSQGDVSFHNGHDEDFYGYDNGDADWIVLSPTGDILHEGAQAKIYRLEKEENAK